MSGGGTKVLRGRMSSRLHVDVTPQQLSELEKSLGRDEQALQECAQRRAELEGTVKTLRGEIVEGERELKKLGREVQVCVGFYMKGAFIREGLPSAGTARADKSS